MQRRPRELFVPRMRPEEPYKEDRKRLISRYKKGGVDFEGDFVDKIGRFPTSWFVFTSPDTGEELQWKYVGEGWWCRSREKPRRSYEFARIVALVNYGDDVNKIDGLWDERRHKVKQPPVLVRSGDRKGVVVGRNAYEVFVQWFMSDGSRSPSESFTEIDRLEFEFEEDFREYSKIFANIRRC